MAPKPSLLMIATVVLLGLGTCATAAAILVPDMLAAGTVGLTLTAGVVATIGATAALWRTQQRRDAALPH